MCIVCSWLPLLVATPLRRHSCPLLSLPPRLTPHPRSLSSPSLSLSLPLPPLTCRKLSSWAPDPLRWRPWRRRGATTPSTSPSCPAPASGESPVARSHAEGAEPRQSPAHLLPTPSPPPPFRRWVMPFSRQHTLTALSFMPLLSWPLKVAFVQVGCPISRHFLPWRCRCCQRLSAVCTRGRSGSSRGGGGGGRGGTQWSAMQRAACVLTFLCLARRRFPCHVTLCSGGCASFTTNPWGWATCRPPGRWTSRTGRVGGLPCEAASFLALPRSLLGWAGVAACASLWWVVWGGSEGCGRSPPRALRKARSCSTCHAKRPHPAPHRPPHPAGQCNDGLFRLAGEGRLKVRQPLVAPTAVALPATTASAAARASRLRRRLPPCPSLFASVNFNRSPADDYWQGGPAGGQRSGWVLLPRRAMDRVRARGTPSDRRSPGPRRGRRGGPALPCPALPLLPASAVIATQPAPLPTPAPSPLWRSGDHPRGRGSEAAGRRVLLRRGVPVQPEPALPARDGRG